MDTDNFKTKNIVIEKYKIAWRNDFVNIAQNLRNIFPEAKRIDHIGSTSIPNFYAKDIIDIQITVADLSQSKSIIDTLLRHNYKPRNKMVYDSFVEIKSNNSEELQKIFSREIEGDRRANIHIREENRLNQKYALLFRDYLKISKASRDSYLIIKKHLATIFPSNIEGYLSIKNPVMDLIFESAKMWAKETNWQMDKKHM